MKKQQSPVDEVIEMIKKLDRELVATQRRILEMLQDKSLGDVRCELAETISNGADIIEFLKADTTVKRLNFVLLSLIRKKGAV